MAGISVQFVGLNEVMKAYDNKDCPRWAVCQGKNINFSYSGGDMAESRAELMEWLMMLSRRDDEDNERYNTQAVYTLKFYDSLRDKKINASTAEDSAFNFRLTDTGRIKQLPARSSQGIEIVLEQLREMKAEMQEVRKIAEKPAVIGNAEDKLETWEKVLDHPITMGLVGKIFGIDVSGLMMDGAKMAGVSESSLDAIIDELLQADPNLKEHLGKLLVIYQTNPSQFKMLIGMIDKM